MNDDGHMEALYREAQQRQINAMHAMAEAAERNAAALMTMEPGKSPRYEYRRQAGGVGNDFQPIAPGPEWELSHWNETTGTAYLWRRIVHETVG